MSMPLITFKKENQKNITFFRSILLELFCFCQFCHVLGFFLDMDQIDVKMN